MHDPSLFEDFRASGRIVPAMVDKVDAAAAGCVLIVDTAADRETWRGHAA